MQVQKKKKNKQKLQILMVIALMERKGIRHITTGDDDFKVVSGIVQWSPVG